MLKETGNISLQRKKVGLSKRWGLREKEKRKGREAAECQECGWARGGRSGEDGRQFPNPRVTRSYGPGAHGVFSTNPKDSQLPTSFI